MKRRLSRMNPRHPGAYRRPLTSQLEFLESRMLLSVAFTNNDMARTWTFAGTGAEGSISFDNGGNISGGSLLDISGSTFNPTGTYTLNSDGTLVVTAGGNSNVGAMNPAKDLIIAADSVSQHAVTILVSSGGASFSNSDLAGTWTLEAEGDSPNSNSSGTISFDGAGHITGGSVSHAGGSEKILGGTYTVNADGTLTAGVITPSGNGTPHTLTLTGAMNGSKDFIAVNPTDLQTAASNNDSLLVTMVRSTGGYSSADMAGMWTIGGEKTYGAVILDSSGHIVSGSLFNNHGTFALTGSAALTSKGVFTFNVTATGNAGVNAIKFTGAMNASKNAIAMNHVDSANGDNMTVLIHSSNHAPTLKTMAPFSTAVDTQPFDITFEQLLAASDAADSDGDTLHFQMTSLGSGTFMLNGGAAPATPFLVSAGDTLTWTPAAKTTGNVSAFTVRASDGTLSSSTDVAVKIKTVLPPTISVTANKNKASEINDGVSSGVGAITISRTNGDPTKALDVHFTLGGSAALTTNYTLNNNGSSVTDTVAIPAGAKSVTVNVVPVDDHVGTGPLTVILTLATDSQYALISSAAKTQATVTIADKEPVVSVTASRKTTSEKSTGSTGQFTISRSGGDATQPLVVSVNLGGTGELNTNYYVPGNAGVGGTLTIPANAKSATITIVAINNHHADVPNLTVVLTLVSDDPYFVNPTGNSATVTILDAG